MHNKKCYKCLKIINSGNNRTITFPRTQRNHNTLSKNTLQWQVLNTGAKRKETENICEGKLLSSP